MSEPTWTATELADWLENTIAPQILISAAFAPGSWPDVKAQHEREAGKARAAAALLRKQGPKQ
jgi:hypothetical protein